DKSLISEKEKVDTLRKIIAHQTYLLYLKGITRKESGWWYWLGWDEYSRQKKYASFLLDYEQKLAGKIDSKLQNIKSMKEKKSLVVAQMQETRNDKKKENQRLARGYKNKKGLISKIKSDQKLLAESIKQKKVSYEKLKKYMRELETKRLARKTGKKTIAAVNWEKLSGSFPKLKGKLNWPVKGKIISRFGRHQDKKYKIVAVNNGIDIKAKKGTSVRSVHDGIVVKVTYMGGFGNTIIVDHNDAYYTVYSHLDEVSINENVFAKSGQILGSVGDSGSLDGAKLHFEIYSKNKPRNPETWLK
ncbi:MAG: M23 family metallopeptidase, partial [Calditrichia bacterium]|nr:M23 family metallopeptidase [Calditrichia bacterium]